MKSAPETLKLIEQNLENADGQEADALIAELKEWEIWGSMSGGSLVGFFPALFAIDYLDDAVDGSELDDNVKAALKWTERGVDLALGVLGTAMNGYTISKGNGKWYHYFLSGASVTQIPVSIYKMAELGGVIGGGGGGANAKEMPIADLRKDLNQKLAALEAKVQGAGADAQTKLPKSRGQEIKILT